MVYCLCYELCLIHIKHLKPISEWSSLMADPNGIMSMTWVLHTSLRTWRPNTLEHIFCKANEHVCCSISMIRENSHPYMLNEPLKIASCNQIGVYCNKALQNAEWHSTVSNHWCSTIWKTSLCSQLQMRLYTSLWHLISVIYQSTSNNNFLGEASKLINNLKYYCMGRPISWNNNLFSFRELQRSPPISLNTTKWLQSNGGFFFKYNKVLALS